MEPDPPQPAPQSEESAPETQPITPNPVLPVDNPPANDASAISPEGKQPVLPENDIPVTEEDTVPAESPSEKSIEFTPVAETSSPTVSEEPTAPVSEITAPSSQPQPPQSEALFHSWFATYRNKMLSVANATRMARKRKKMDHIVELAGKRGSITRHELIMTMHTSVAQIERYLRALVLEGKLKKVGHVNEGRYERVE